MTGRRGYSLIELLVVLAAASTVLTVSAVLLHRTMQMAAKTRAFHVEEATAWRLAALLRNDAAGAESIDLSKAEADLSVTIRGASSEPIVYRFSGSRAERTQRLDGGREARDSFELPSVAKWRGETLGMTNTVRMNMVRIEALPSDVVSRSQAPPPFSLVFRAAGETRQ